MICSISNTLPGTKAYSSVQVLPDPPISNPNQLSPSPSAASSSNSEEVEVRHIELNSDLLFVNHSCDPNVAFEVPKGGPWCVRALRDLKVGEVSISVHLFPTSREKGTDGFYTVIRS